MSISAIVVGAMPLVAALASLIGTYLVGFDLRTPVPAGVGTRFYGFFLDHYPLFTFAIVYALARVIAAALARGPSAVPRRVIGAATGVALILALCLHPTFGGLVLRGAFMSGGVAFLNQVPMTAAYALGAAVAAALLGAAMGLGVVIAGQPARARAPWTRRVLRSAASGFVRFAALWYALAILGIGRGIGIGPWPHRPLDAGGAALVLGCLVVAFLPHVVISTLRADTTLQTTT